jgi:hypothetical protein
MIDYDFIIAMANCFIAFANTFLTIIVFLSFVFHFDPAGRYVRQRHIQSVTDEFTTSIQTTSSIDDV